MMTMPLSAAIDPAAPLIAWPEFRDGLPALDITHLDGRRDDRRSWIVDNAFGDVSLRNVGSLGVALRGERTQSRINEYQEELIWICLVLRGKVRITQQRETAALGAGDMAMVDALQHYAIETSADPSDTLWIGAPRHFLAQHIWDVDEMLGVRINGSGGMGRTAARTLCAGFSDPAAVTGSAANRVAHGLFDVLGAAADSCRLHHAGRGYRDTIVRRIKSFIDAHLDDETLTVQRIAEAQGLSARYLAKMFEGEPHTVSNWIWSRRLERCHAALVEAGGRRAITEIAFEHGFKNVSHFSRAFRDRYGMSPRDVAQGKGKVL